MENQKKIAQLLDNYKKNLILISITKNANTSFVSQEQLKTFTLEYQFCLKENFYSFYNFPDQEQYLYNNIFSLCSKYKNKVIFVIFNEYFFGKIIMKKDELNNICTNLNKISEKLPDTYIIFFVNVLIEEKEINIKEMEIYKKYINISDFIFCPTEKKIQYTENKGYYSNSTYIIFDGQPIIKYSKASFSNELENINYKFGFGDMVILIENELSKKISDLVDIYLCMDLTIRPYLKLINNIDFSFTGDKDSLKEMEDLQELIKKHQSGKEKKKKIIIIQSNSIELSSNLDNFNDGMILVQADPKASLAVQINYTSFIENILEQSNNYYINAKNYLNNKYFQNYEEKKMHIFHNEYKYFNFKKRLLSINSMAITNNLSACNYFNNTTKEFNIQINTFSLENIQK